MPQRGQRSARRAGPAGMLLGVGLALLAAAVGTAPPAHAAQDPARPRATVTRGPSCVPGGLALEVQAGTVAVHVVLATTRSPEGEDATDLAAGATAVLRTRDVDPGETIDGRLVSTPADGSGEAWVDELDDWTLTRPTATDCAIATGAVPATPSAVVTDGAAGSDGAASRAVGAGRPITVTARGFEPGEPVTVRLDGGNGGNGEAEVLASGTADADGAVALRLTVPAHAAGATGLDLTGGSSGAAARVQLQVAALLRVAPPRPVHGGGTPVLLPLAALASLTATGGALVPVARRATALRRSARVPGRG